MIDYDAGTLCLIARRIAVVVLPVNWAKSVKSNWIYISCHSLLVHLPNFCTSSKFAPDRARSVVPPTLNECGVY